MRGRRAKTFSFLEADDRALTAGRARLSRIIPRATESETVRLALSLLQDVSSEVIERAALRLKRTKAGRPRTLAGVPFDLSAKEDADRQERFELLEELFRLEKQESDETRERLRSLYAQLGMVPSRDRIQKAGGS
jgi:hypothetical protein